MEEACMGWGIFWRDGGNFLSSSLGTRRGACKALTLKRDPGSQPETMAVAALADSMALLTFLCFLSIAPSFSCSLRTTVNFMECFLPGAGLCSLPAFLPVIVTRNPWHHPKGSDLCSPKHSLPAPVLNTCMSSLIATPEGLEG